MFMQHECSVNQILHVELSDALEIHIIFSFCPALLHQYHAKYGLMTQDHRHFLKPRIEFNNRTAKPERGKRANKGW